MNNSPYVKTLTKLYIAGDENISNLLAFGSSISSSDTNPSRRPWQDQTDDATFSADSFRSMHHRHHTSHYQ